MATVESYQLANGSKRYRVRYRTPDRRSTDKRGFTTLREAKQFASEVEVSKMTGAYVSPASGRVTVGSRAEPWLTRPELKAASLSALRSAWDCRVAAQWADVPVGSIQISEVRAWVVALDARGFAGKTIAQAVGILKGILDTCVEDKIIVANPAANVKTPRSRPVPRRYLTHEQVETLRHKVSANDSTLILFLAYTGLRISEAAALKVGSFDMLRRRVMITEAAVAVRGKMITGTPKTHKSRSVPFPKFLADEVAALMVGKSRDDLVFTAPRGGQLNSVSWGVIFRRAVAQCQAADPEFPTISTHSLRHTAASLAISAGANVKAVQRMLGHASAAMTLDTYSDLFPDDLDAVADRLDDAREKSVGKLWARGSSSTSL